MKHLINYSGWLKRQQFEEYILIGGISHKTAFLSLLSEMEQFQFDFIMEDQHFKGGWIDTVSDKRFGCDTLASWSRQYEYPYVANIVNDHKKYLEKRLNILDVGSGYSFFPFYLLTQHNHMTCLDIEDFSEQYDKSQIKFIRGDIGSKKTLKDRLKDESFDIIYCISVIEHMGQNRSAAIENMYNLLKKGGKLIITMDCDLRMETERPNYWHIAKIVRQLNLLFSKPLHEFNLNRKDLITTHSFIETTDSWRLPWRKRNYEQIPELTIFLGVWKK